MPSGDVSGSAAMISQLSVTRRPGADAAAQHQAVFEARVHVDVDAVPVFDLLAVVARPASRSCRRPARTCRVQVEQIRDRPGRRRPGSRGSGGAEMLKRSKSAGLTVRLSVTRNCRTSGGSSRRPPTCAAAARAGRRPRTPSSSRACPSRRGCPGRRPNPDPSWPRFGFAIAPHSPLAAGSNRLQSGTIVAVRVSPRPRRRVDDVVRRVRTGHAASARWRRSPCTCSG